MRGTWDAPITDHHTFVFGGERRFETAAASHARIRTKQVVAVGFIRLAIIGTDHTLWIIVRVTWDAPITDHHTFGGRAMIVVIIAMIVVIIISVVVVIIIIFPGGFVATTVKPSLHGILTTLTHLAFNPIVRWRNTGIHSWKVLGGTANTP